jgi:hypothetical protein
MLVRIVAVIALSVLFAGCASIDRNSPVGNWAGTLDMAGASLRLVFHITESENGYSATIESVDQGGVIIPTQIDVMGDSLTFAVAQIGVEYSATISGDQIVGIFKQAGMSAPDFTLSRVE